MLSSLTTLVPVLTGPNYQVWAPAMKSFLMSQGQWHVLSHPCPYDITLDKDGDALDTDKLPSQEKINENQEKIENWEDNNSKAVGNITLHLSPTIQGNYTDPLMESTGILWAALEKLYRKPGVIAIYLEFQAAVETKMTDHEDPSLCINKTIAHLTRIIAVGLDIPKHFQAMILMAKLPPSMDSIAQVMCQEDNVQKLDLSKIRCATSLVWEQRQGKKAPPHNTNKLSMVKHGPNEQPFEQQQGDGQQGGRCPRGCHGG